MTVEAVIFDWGGTLTPWRTSDGRAWWRIAERLVPPDRVEAVGRALAVAENEVWRRSREEHRSGTLTEIFDAAEITDHETALLVHTAEWDWTTHLDPDAPDVLAGLRERGVRVGVLSNTCWPRRIHDGFFARDGVLHLFDGAVYTSEIPWTKPHPEAFRAAMAAIGVTDPGRCVFVGDRLFDDIFGARRAGMRAVFVPHSVIPAEQHGHTLGEPHEVIARLTDLIPLVDRWRGDVAPGDRDRGGTRPAVADPVSRVSQVSPVSQASPVSQVSRVSPVSQASPVSQVSPASVSDGTT